MYWKSIRAFTLIELLVVMSIIALLIGILMPALGAARTTAMNMKCLSNMRQCAIAHYNYSTDNDGYIYTAGHYAATWSQLLCSSGPFKYHPETKGVTAGRGQGYIGISDDPTSGLTVVSCPNTEYGDYNNHYPVWTRSYGMGFGHEGVMAGGKWQGYFMNMDRLGCAPAEHMLMGDSTLGCEFAEGKTKSYMNYWKVSKKANYEGWIGSFYAQHRKGTINMAFYDGHVEAVALQGGKCTQSSKTNSVWLQWGKNQKWPQFIISCFNEDGTITEVPKE